MNKLLVVGWVLYLATAGVIARTAANDEIITPQQTTTTGAVLTVPGDVPPAARTGAPANEPAGSADTAATPAGVEPPAPPPLEPPASEPAPSTTEPPAPVLTVPDLPTTTVTLPDVTIPATTLPTVPVVGVCDPCSLLGATALTAAADLVVCLPGLDGGLRWA